MPVFDVVFFFLTGAMGTSMVSIGCSLLYSSIRRVKTWLVVSPPKPTFAYKSSSDVRVRRWSMVERFFVFIRSEKA